MVQPPKGSVLLNFGGPGEPDRQNLAELASILQPLSGGLYDLIAFDTRYASTLSDILLGQAV